MAASQARPIASPSGAGARCRWASAGGAAPVPGGLPRLPHTAVGVGGRPGDPDGVAALQLRPVQRLVGAGEHDGQLHRGVARLDHRNADADGDRFGQGRRLLADRAAQALRHQLGVDGQGVRQQHAELLPAEPGGQVLRADVRGDDLGDVLERVIATQMAVSLVVEPEVVDVGEDHGPGSAGRAHPPDLLDGQPLPGVEHQQAGLGVPSGPFLQRAVQHGLLQEPVDRDQQEHEPRRVRPEQAGERADREHAGLGQVEGRDPPGCGGARRRPAGCSATPSSPAWPIPPPGRPGRRRP